MLPERVPQVRRVEEIRQALVNQRDVASREKAEIRDLGTNHHNNKKHLALSYLECFGLARGSDEVELVESVDKSFP